MFNPFGTYTRNGVPAATPDGFRDVDFAYVISNFPDTGGGVLLPGFGSATAQIFTYDDSIFIWTGIDVPFLYQIGVRIRYGNEYLNDTFVNFGSGITVAGVVSGSGSPFPLFPAHLPPGTQITVEVVNLLAQAFSNLQLSLTGMRRFKTT